MEGSPFVRYVYPLFDDGIIIIGCAKKIPEKSSETHVYLEPPECRYIQYSDVATLNKKQVVKRFFDDHGFTVPSEYVRATPCIMVCKPDVFIEELMKPGQVIFDRGEQKQFLVEGVSPKDCDELLYRVLPLFDWLSGEQQQCSFFKPHWKPGSAKPILDAKPMLLRSGGNFPPYVCGAFTPLSFIETLQMCVQNWRFGQIGSICEGANGDYDVKLFGKNVTLDSFMYSTLNLSSFTFEKTTDHRTINHRVVDHRVIVVTTGNKELFGEGDWVCYDTSTKHKWMFIKSTKDLLRFVKWIRNPPEQFPKKIWFGSFYPFVLAFYQKPYQSRDADCFIRDLQLMQKKKE